MREWLESVPPTTHTHTSYSKIGLKSGGGEWSESVPNTPHPHTSYGKIGLKPRKGGGNDRKVCHLPPTHIASSLLHIFILIPPLWAGMVGQIGISLRHPCPSIVSIWYPGVKTPLPFPCSFPRFYSTSCIWCSNSRTCLNYFIILQ